MFLSFVFCPALNDQQISTLNQPYYLFKLLIMLVTCNTCYEQRIVNSFHIF